jgi:anhydro-N-acetylmuramic acid kinase
VYFVYFVVSMRQATVVLGIMSGTSMDGVDYAVCRIRVGHCELMEHWHVGFDRGMKLRLMAAAANRASSHEVAQLHHDLGRFYARHAKRSKRRLELVGLHGQTIFHNPKQPNPATLQIGEPAYLAEALRATVVSNFRAADIAAGGQGAPLATAFHVMVFGREGRHVCVNNIGGISNVTSIDRTRSREQIRAFDTGPGNLLIDLAMRELTSGRMQMDEDGKWARRGKAHEQLLRQWLRHPYFAAPPPKSTGREMLGEEFFAKVFASMTRKKMSPYDIVRTLTEFTARSIALNYRRHLPSLPSLVVVTGGGAANPVLVELLKGQLRQLADVTVTDSTAFDWPHQAIEPAAFALLAKLRSDNRAGNIPSTTGARHGAILGQVCASPYLGAGD